MNEATKYFGKGCGCLHVYDPYTNDLLIRKDNLKTSSFAITANEEEVTSGVGNTLDILLLDSTKVQVDLSTSDVDNIMRGMSMGSLPSNGGRVSYNEVVTATAAGITLKKVPVSDIGAMSADVGVRISGVLADGSTVNGKFIKVSATAPQTVSDEQIVDGNDYSVEYTVWDNKAQTSRVSSLPSPMVVRAVFTQPLFATESVTAYGSRVGQDNYVIPLGILTPVMTIGGEQTAASTTTFTIRAIKYEELSQYDVTDAAFDEAMREARAHANGACDDIGRYNLAYVTREIWSNSNYYAKVSGLAVIGGALSVKKGEKKVLPLKEILNNGTTNVPTYADYNYVSAAPTTASISDKAVVEGKAAGNTTITVTGKGEGFAPAKLSCVIAVTVSAE
jgi:hypothetical protein